ncbi:hypothetical protein FNH22_08710 [Fulvivirga sp. M361]|uniref:hypothetical protein n=1 Tax=Fulvivirga sp. M361 TaxID=2594266 RepID=UPI001179E572|nr:hypothetical protein [Fulvivirga sp. M361]TRX60120.1 hypothetical protein FNH22_08710 [Fulvivirga sp. M361]
MIKRFIRVISINLIVLVVLLLAINWICGVFLRSNRSERWNLPNYADNRALGRKIFEDYNRIKHRYHPFTGWKTKSYSGPTTNIQNNGLRYTPQTKINTTQKSVHFFGGSTMWGEGSSDSTTIPSLFAYDNHSYAVYNHGQLAYNSRQNLAELVNKISRGEKMDIVVFYDGVNDASFLCPTEIDVPGHRLVPSFQKRLYGSNTTYIVIMLEKLFVRNILNLINRFSDEANGSAYNCAGNIEKVNQIANGMINNWTMAKTLVEANGGQFIAVLQPGAYVGNAKVDHLELDNDLKDNFISIYNALSNTIDSLDYDWIYDFTDAFDRDEYIYVDFCHVSANGNRIISKRISEAIGALSETSNHHTLNLNE